MKFKHILIAVSIAVVAAYIIWGGVADHPVENQRFNDYGEVAPGPAPVQAPIMSFMGWQMILILLGLVGIGLFCCMIWHRIDDLPGVIASQMEVYRAKERERE